MQEQGGGGKTKTRGWGGGGKGRYRVEVRRDYCSRLKVLTAKTPYHAEMLRKHNLKIRRLLFCPVHINQL